MASPMRRCLLTALLIASPPGCGESPPSRPPRQPTHGTVTYNGKPPDGAVVQFWPLPLDKIDWRTVKPSARVGPDGTFRLNTYEMSDGAIVGDYVVTVLWTGSNPDVPRPDLFQGRYSDPNKPVLKVSIKEGENAIPPINLTGPPVNPNNGWVDPVTNQKQ
jgi:hypothetical protein